jgi:hypothetical protein
MEDLREKALVFDNILIKFQKILLIIDVTAGVADIEGLKEFRAPLITLLVIRGA